MNETKEHNCYAISYSGYCQNKITVKLIREIGTFGKCKGFIQNYFLQI